MAARTPGYLRGWGFSCRRSIVLRARLSTDMAASHRAVSEESGKRGRGARSFSGGQRVQGAPADDLARGRALDGAGLGIEPDDGAGRTALDRDPRAVVPGVVDDRQVVVHRDQAGCVHGAAAASGAGDLAVREQLVAGLERAAGDPEPVADRVEREEVLRAGLDAVAAGRALALVDHRQ